MNRSREMEKYLMPLLLEEPEEITATALQREYENGYLDGQKKAYDECDEIARELSQIKSGCSKWLDGHDEKIRADEREKHFKAIMEFINTPNRGECDYFIVDQIEDYIMARMKEGKQK